MCNDKGKKKVAKLLQNKNALGQPITISNAIHFGKSFAWAIIYVNSRFTAEYERIRLIIF